MTVLKFEHAPGEADYTAVAVGYKLFSIIAEDDLTHCDLKIICHTCGHSETITSISPATIARQWNTFNITSYEVWDDDEMHTSVECCSCGAIEGKPGTYEIVRAW